MLVAIYTITIFLSAALLFIVQPMFARMALPLLGGSPYVWNTALVFYQAALLLGYTYAHFSTKLLGVRKQALAHIVVLGLPLLVLPIGIADASPPTASSPVPWLLLTMIVSVGLPFFVVSASSPLLQRWFAATGHKAAPDPYFLYVASNLGSMIALFAYPFYVEPSSGLLQQSKTWTIVYGVFALFMAICAVVAWRVGKDAAPIPAMDEKDIALPRLECPTWPRRLRWIAYAFVPSSLMVGTTTCLTTDIASVPLLWVFPLAAYLFSFMLVFSPNQLLPHTTVIRVLRPLVVLTLAIFLLPITQPAIPIGTLSMLTLFVGAMAFHGELARDRPAPSHLTEFFLLISLGGVLGGLFAGILAPMLFTMVVEYPLTLVLAGFLIPGQRAVWKRSMSWMPPLVAAATYIGVLIASSKGLEPHSTQSLLVVFLVPASLCFLAGSDSLRFGLCLTAMLLVGMWKQDFADELLYRDRTFFGSLRVYERGEGFRKLRHGTIIHGIQDYGKGADSVRNVPLSYYYPTGPIGQVFLVRGLPSNAAVGVVGLGVGSIVSYGKRGQEWTFYEIDPGIVRIAKNPELFSYWADRKCNSKIVLGDARLQLARTTEQYDLLVLDAYNSDAIPVHLLTQEALAIYMKHLKLNGVLALHLSNRNIRLDPVVAALTKAAHLACIIRSDLDVTREERLLGKAASVWALVARSPNDFGVLQRSEAWGNPIEDPDVQAWTDDFSNVFQVMRFTF